MAYRTQSSGTMPRARWPESEDTRIEHEQLRSQSASRRRELAKSRSPSKQRRNLGGPSANLLARTASYQRQLTATASVDEHMQYTSRKTLTRRRTTSSSKTIHDEMTDVPISSDDSSDDDEVQSRASRKTRATVHREANGIWVSSDDESDDNEVKSQQWRSRRSRRAHSYRTSEGLAAYSDTDIRMRSGSRSSASSSTFLDQYQQQNRISSFQQAQQEHFSSQQGGSSGSSGGGGDSEGPMRFQSRANAPPTSSPTASSLGSNRSSRYWSSSSSETSSISGSIGETTLRQRRPRTSSIAHLGTQPAHGAGGGYESFDSVSLASTVASEATGYMSAASLDRRSIQRGIHHSRAGGYRASGLSQGNNTAAWGGISSSVTNFATNLHQHNSYSEQGTIYEHPSSMPSGVSYVSSTSSSPTIHSQSQECIGPQQAQYQLSQSSNPQRQMYEGMLTPIQLHAVQFWDPDGTKALLADRGSTGGGIAVGVSLFAFGFWAWGLVVFVLTILTASSVSTMYRLSKWRGSSGIEQQALFNEMYEIVEQVCTDTRITLPTGEMRPRLVCAGELGTALDRHFPGLDEATKLRFWTEACVHFRLTLRSGCHHLGQGKLHPRNLATSTLGTMTKNLPHGICPSCDNKIAIEAKFPLKCD